MENRTHLLLPRIQRILVLVLWLTHNSTVRQDTSSVLSSFICSFPVKFPTLGVFSNSSSMTAQRRLPETSRPLLNFGTLCSGFDLFLCLPASHELERENLKSVEYAKTSKKKTHLQTLFQESIATQTNS